MHAQLQSTVPSRLSRNNYRTTARIVGVLYLTGMVVGIGGNLFVQSILGAPDHLSTIAANSTLLALGAVLWLSTVTGDAAHGILMFPVLKPHSERAALGYLGRDATSRGQRYAVILDKARKRIVGVGASNRTS
jgi:Domain of unknown function (DUF4386)